MGRGTLSSGGCVKMGGFASGKRGRDLENFEGEVAGCMGRREEG